MAPGAGSKLEEEDDHIAKYDTTNPLPPSVEVANLSPKLQKLVKEYYDLGWIERLCGFTAPIVWRNVIIMAVLHVMTIMACFYGPYAKWESWWFFLVLYLFAGLGVTAGVHRYWSHKSYKAKLPLQIILMISNCLSMQNDILEWSRDHRVHHKYSETTADPHNARRGFFFAHIGWLLMKKHPDVFIKGKNVDISDLQRDPVVQFQHRFYLPMCLFMTIVIPVGVPWLCWGEDPWVAFFCLSLFRYVMTLHSTWLVNSAAHLWGSRRYDNHLH